MVFKSILYDKDNTAGTEAAKAPDFFSDLNLDQIVDAITAGRDEYNLKPVFYSPLRDTGTIVYRQSVMRDLEDNELIEKIKLYTQRMRSIIQSLDSLKNIGYKYFEEGLFLDAVNDYCEAIDLLKDDLINANLSSSGLLSFREYVSGYTGSDGFKTLRAQAAELKKDLSEIRYCMTVKSNCIKVRKYEGEPDYSADVLKTFEKFKSGAVKDYRIKLRSTYEINHVMSGVLDLLARLYPGVFSRLSSFCAKNKVFIDETINNFYREIQFYVSCLDYINDLKCAGLKFCYPEISSSSKEIYSYEGFDLALAYNLTRENCAVVCNDFYLKGKERVIVVSGPNQGGKTTFARAFGQAHYLASLGCPVPGREARLYLFDRIFTHFERVEDLSNLRGKLQDDIVRFRGILNEATPQSIIIMNETFNSATLNDAVFLSKKIMADILRLDSLCVCVTFIVEIADMSEKTVSMVSTVVPENPATRTFKIIRKKADGLAYAHSIAEKYRLTFDRIKERIEE